MKAKLQSDQRVRRQRHGACSAVFETILPSVRARLRLTPHRNRLVLQVCGQLHIADSGTFVVALPSRNMAWCSVSTTPPASCSSLRAQFSQAASYCAQLRSSSRRTADTSSFITLRRIAVESLPPSPRPSVPVQCGPLSNKRLVPTANSLSPVGPRAACGAAASEPRRWAQ